MESEKREEEEGEKGREGESVRVLAVFDFDETIVNENTDDRVRCLIPDVDYWAYYQPGKWTDMMDRLLGIMHERGYNEEDVKKTFLDMPPVPGMPFFIRYLAERNVTIAILSDSNSYFISCVLDYLGLKSCITDVITNPAPITNGRIHIVPRQHTFGVSHTCPSCPYNLCKGSEMVRLMASHNPLRVVYCGDGQNDWCAAKTLRRGDVLLAREGHALHSLTQENSQSLQMKDVNVTVWRTGEECVDALKRYGVIE